jgi:hypothetical protein
MKHDSRTINDPVDIKEIDRTTVSSHRFDVNALETAARKWWESQREDDPINRLTGKPMKPWEQLHPSTQAHIIEDVKIIIGAYRNEL